MITICSGNRKCTNEFIKYKSFGTIYPPPCSRNKTKKKKKKKFLLSSFNRFSPLDVSFAVPFLWIHPLESHLSLNYEWESPSNSIWSATLHIARNSILHAGHYITKVSHRWKEFVLNSLSSPRKTRRSRDFPHFRFFCSVILSRIKLEPPSLPRFFPRLVTIQIHLQCAVFIIVMWISTRL